MPLTELLQRLLRLSKMSNNEEFRNTMDAAYNVALAFLSYQLHGDCNTCERKTRCRWEPAFGGQVRTNCPHYLGAEKWEPPAVKAKNAMKIDGEGDGGAAT